MKSKHLDITMVPPKLTKIAGSEATLKCEVKGSSDYEITWSFAGGQIQSKAKLQSMGKELVIPSLTVDDTGNYACRAVDEFGNVKTSSSALKVMRKIITNSTLAYTHVHYMPYTSVSHVGFVVLAWLSKGIQF